MISQSESKGNFNFMEEQEKKAGVPIGTYYRLRISDCFKVFEKFKNTPIMEWYLGRWNQLGRPVLWHYIDLDELEIKQYIKRRM